jgi:ADP-ribose pyrophosphatase YjhB (NUDIX family)
VRSLLDLAYRLQKRLWRLLRPKTRGVKIMLLNDTGEILLIRNNYGRTHQFVLPGGGVRPWETPEKAASREVREELGCDARELQPVSTHFTAAEGKRDTVHVFRARLSDEPKPDNFEVLEARFFPPAKLPKDVSPATRRRVEELLGKRDVTPDW